MSPKTPSSIAEPCFLVGAECSGATVLRLMLDHHPEVAFISEMEFVVSELPEQEWPEMEPYLEWLKTSRVFHDTGFRVDRRLSYPDLMDSFLMQKLDWGGPAKHIVGGTVHYYFDRLLRLWPGARFIHLVRDPRDVALSCKTMGWAGNIWAGVGPWMEAERLWKELKKGLPKHAYAEVTFEELAHDTVPTLTHLCNFLGVRYSPAMLDYPKRTSYDLPDPGQVEEWKHKLSPEDIRLAEARMMPMLIERGYEPSGQPPITITPAMERRLRRQDKLGRIRCGLRRYGVGNMTAGFVSRRLHLKRMQRRVLMRRHMIDQVHLK